MGQVGLLALPLSSRGFIVDFGLLQVLNPIVEGDNPGRDTLKRASLSLEKLLSGKVYRDRLLPDERFPGLRRISESEDSAIQMNT